MAIELVCSDFDGFIADSRDFTWGLRNREYPEISLAEYIEWHDKMNFFDALGKSGYKKREDIDYGALYAEGILDVRPFAGIVEAIAEISANGFAQSIVSGNEGTPIEAYLRKHGLRQHFAHVLGSDYHKSKVVKFEEVMRRHGVIADETLYLTDTVGDINEARTCGIRCIAVTWGYCSGGVMWGANPAALIDSPGELMSAITNLQKGLL